jgi:hypothetical protein
MEYSEEIDMPTGDMEGDYLFFGGFPNESPFAAGDIEDEPEDTFDLADVIMFDLK